MRRGSNGWSGSKKHSEKELCVFLIQPANIELKQKRVLHYLKPDIVCGTEWK
jgi:hypothetical protein